jgi:hypothetical protein
MCTHTRPHIPMRTCTHTHARAIVCSPLPFGLPLPTNVGCSPQTVKPATHAPSQPPLKPLLHEVSAIFVSLACDILQAAALPCRSSLHVTRMSYTRFPCRPFLESLPLAFPPHFAPSVAAAVSETACVQVGTREKQSSRCS